jgi:cell division protease FtsH
MIGRGLRTIWTFIGDLATKPVETLIELVSWPLWFLDFVKRNSQLRNFLIWFTITSALVIVFLGVGIWLTGLLTIGQMALSLVMMIGQFVVLFSFLSSTKTIELYPGQEGLFTFGKDYFGNEVLVEAVRDWVGSLGPESKRFLDDMGAEAINGIMLEGPPGTGKTLLAQCLATESGAAFFGTSGTDYQAMFIGVGPMKIMRMYSKARKAAAQYGSAIVFIDEIDAIGGNRGGVSGNNNNALGGMFGGGGLGVLSKLLTELDGTKEVGRRFQIINNLRGAVGLPEIPTGLVLTIGATNRFSSLDPALVRPGRIDKVIQVPQPDKQSRRLIIEGYLAKVRHDANDIDVDGMVEDTAGVTPAQLASAIQRSAPRYAMNAKRLWVTQADIDSALQEDLVGLANPIADWDRKQRKSVAIHEAGHAVMAWLVRRDKRITTVSIVRRGGGILGYVRDVDTQEVFSQPLERISANIMVSLAGYHAVELYFDEPWTGASADFDHIRYYINALAMNAQFGNVPLSGGANVMGGFDPLSDPDVNKAANRYLDATTQQTRRLLEKHNKLLLMVAGQLLLKDELSSRDFYAITERYERDEKASGRTV